MEENNISFIPPPPSNSKDISFFTNDVNYSEGTLPDFRNTPPPLPSVIPPIPKNNVDTQTGDSLDLNTQTINSLSRPPNLDDLENTKDIIFDDSKKVKAASFTKIIELLTHPRDYDTSVLHDFILTYRSFATSFEVVSALKIRYEQAINNSSEYTKDTRVICMRILNVLKHWIEKCWWDFSKDCPALSDMCNSFLDQCQKNSDTTAAASSIQKRLMAMLSSDGGHGVGKGTALVVNTSTPLWSTKDMGQHILEVNSEELSRQLTMVEWNIWSKIQAWECLGLSWTKKDKEERAKNVLSLINRFNTVSDFVASAVCSQEQSKKRTKLILKFIEIALSLYSVGNLNGLMEIVSGLNRGPIFRLKASWDGLNSQMRSKIDELFEITNRAKSYAAMRRVLRQLNPPCIPYLGIYLTDLTFIEEGNKDYIGELINWNKRHQISETIRSIKQYQQQAYTFTEIPEIQDILLNHLPTATDDDLYLCSEYLEPRSGKERSARPPFLNRLQASFDSLIIKPISKRNEKQQSFNIASLASADYPFNEPDTLSNIEVDNTEVIVSGTLEKIIDRLTHNLTPDSMSQQGFLLFYRRWTTPEKLFDLLMLRYRFPKPKEFENDQIRTEWEGVKAVIELRTFNFLLSWVDRHPYDFTGDNGLLQKLNDFANLLGAENQPNVKKTWSNKLKGLIEKRINSKTGLTLESASPEIIPNIVNLLDFDNEEFARQLTLLHHNLFTNIFFEQIVDYLASENSKMNDNDSSKTQSIDNYVNAGLSLKAWVTDDLIKAVSGQKDFPRILSKWKEISSSLVLQRNYFSVLSIIEGMQQYSSVASTSFDPATEQCIRSISEQISNSENDPKDSPIVPPLTKLIKKMQEFPELKMPDYMKTRIYLRKYTKITEILKDFIILQKKNYNFHPVPVVQKFIKDNLENYESNNTKILNNTCLKIIPEDSDYSVPTDYNTTNFAENNNANSEKLKKNLINMVNSPKSELKYEIQSYVNETFKLNAESIKNEFLSTISGNNPKSNNFSNAIKNEVPPKVPVFNPILHSDSRKLIHSSSVGNDPSYFMDSKDNFNDSPTRKNLTLPKTSNATQKIYNSNNGPPAQEVPSLPSVQRRAFSPQFSMKAINLNSNDITASPSNQVNRVPDRKLSLQKSTPPAIPLPKISGKDNSPPPNKIPPCIRPPGALNNAKSGFNNKMLGKNDNFSLENSQNTFMLMNDYKQNKVSPRFAPPPKLPPLPPLNGPPNSKNTDPSNINNPVNPLQPTNTSAVQSLPNDLEFYRIANEFLKKNFPEAIADTWSGNIPQVGDFNIKILQHSTYSLLCDIRVHVTLKDISNLLILGRKYKEINPSKSLACFVLTKLIDEDAEQRTSQLKIKLWKL